MGGGSVADMAYVMSGTFAADQVRHWTFDLLAASHRLILVGPSH